MYTGPGIYIRRPRRKPAARAKDADSLAGDELIFLKKGEVKDGK